MRRAAKVDLNQQAIVDALRQIGCDVEVIGRPVDLLCGYKGVNLLLECKNPKGKNSLAEGQKRFMATWRGQVRVVRAVDEAIRAVRGFVNAD